MEEPMSSFSLYVVGILFTFMMFLVKFGKDIIAFFKKSNQPFDILEEVRSLKKTIQEQSQHIERIEKILEEFQDVIQVLSYIRDHRSRKFLKSITISLGFTDSVRPDEQDQMIDFFLQFERAIRMIPISDKKLSLNYLDTRAMNSHAISDISNFFSHVLMEDVIRLDVLFRDDKIFDKLAKNLNTLRSTTGSENVQVITVKEQSHDGYF